MTTAEIIILIIGAILFTISFFIPDRDEGQSKESFFDQDVAQKVVKDAVLEEMRNIKATISEATEESISENKDKMERFMDRLTNEKMMAVNEYSDTVMNQIHKDHDEAVFLYDMIDNKYNQVKTTVAEINQIEKSVRKISEGLPVGAVATAQTPAKPVAAQQPKITIQPQAKNPVQPKVTQQAGNFKPGVAATPVTQPVNAKQVTDAKDDVKDDVAKQTSEVINKEEPKTEPVAEEARMEEAIKKATESEVVATPEESKMPETKAEEVAEAKAGEEAVEEKPVKKRQTKAKKAEAEEVSTEPIANSDVELMFDNGSMNNNDRILALHKEGKSNMAIAKELGLGVGEVKLVIDLFKSF